MNFVKPDILAVMQHEGIELRQRGRYYWGRCPFHEDRTPSFKVSPERQAYHCFGCGEHGDGIDFVARMHGLDFKKALSYLGIGHKRPTLPDPAVIRQRNLKRAFDAWLKSYRLKLSDQSIYIHSLIHGVKNRTAALPEELAFILAGEMAKLPLIENRLDILFSGNDEAILRLFIEVNP